MYLGCCAGAYRSLSESPVVEDAGPVPSCDVADVGFALGAGAQPWKCGSMLSVPRLRSAKRRASAGAASRMASKLLRERTSARSTQPSDVRLSSRSVRSEEHTSELQSLMRNSYAVFCLKKKNIKNKA